MATNLYFRNWDASNEQNLYEDLIIESIRMYGEDMYYCPRAITNFDAIYTEDDQSQYNSAYLVEMYIKSVDGFSGDGTFLSKFGVEIRDQVVFSISQRVFNQEIGSQNSQPRPNEGDLIYFPLNNKCFQIKYVNKFEMFYPLGALQTWELTCELFAYSNEILNTSIPSIDSLQTNFSLNILDYVLRDQSNNILTDMTGTYLIDESYVPEKIAPGTINDTLQNGSNNFSLGSSGFINFSTDNPFTEKS